jgi:hypothetical protein
VTILGDLARQRETIVHARDTLHGADDNISKARRVLSTMSKRVMANKIIMFAIRWARRQGRIGCLLPPPNLAAALAASACVAWRPVAVGWWAVVALSGLWTRHGLQALPQAHGSAPALLPSRPPCSACLLLGIILIIYYRVKG